MRDRYAEYKDSGLEWIGEIPAHWKTMRFKFIAQLINDKSIHDGKKYIGMENIESWTGKYLDMGEIVPESLCNNFCKGDILFGKLRPYLAKAYIAEENGTCSSEILVFRTSSILRRYLFYLLLSFGFIEHINSSTYGAKMPRANWDFIGKSYIPIPPQDEQNVIVEFLDNKLHKLDHLINERTDQFSMLTRFKRELIAKCVTKGLDKSAPMKPSGEDWIGDVPTHWQIVPLRAFLKPNNRKNPGGLPLLSVERERGVVNRETDGSPDNHNRVPDDLSNYKMVNEGQFVMNKMKAWQGSYGVAPCAGIVSPAYYVYDLVFENKEFFNYAIRSKCYVGFLGRDSYGIRIDQWDFKAERIKHIPFVVPTVEEQQEIVNYLSKQESKINSLQANIEAQIQKLKDYRRILIHDAVTGKIKI
ncbi:restriction endonuclease subunit S [Mitsuokella sp. oral taxon 131]|nr:restriction endonuclease subunit S [Mitsuokella sp. oral taxon 131]ERL04346.1 type I restriction modification DNA specificity domain protein [Mitsuokella sp. oral taxon 131 str. W9106]